MSVRVGWGGEEGEEMPDLRRRGAIDALGAAELLVTIVFALAVAAATLALVLSSA